MEKEARVKVSSLPYGKTEERKGHRNGSITGTLKTVDVEIKMKKPQISEFPFEVHVFEKYAREINAEMWVAPIHKIEDKQWQILFQTSSGILIQDLIRDPN